MSFRKQILVDTTSQNYVLAGPVGSAGTPVFRLLVAGDIPQLAFTKITGTVPLNQGGTGQTTANAALNALLPTQSVANKILVSDGSNTSWGAYTGSGVVSVSGLSISVSQATTSTPGYLSSTDWNTFNSKLSVNQTITLSGDATGSGTTAITITLANSGVTAGTYSKVTVNAKGLVTGSSALASTDITTALGFTPLNKAGGTLTGALTLAADPASALQAATKQYVDNTLSNGILGIKGKTSVKALASSNVTVSNPATSSFDGVTLATGDRLLLTGQTTTAENGIYVFNGSSSALTRASDANIWSGLVSAYVWIEQGTTYGDTGWYCPVDTGGTLGTTAVTWTQFAGSASITNGTGLTKVGNVISLTAVAASKALVSDASGILSASSVTATELGFLSGVTSNIQTQLSSKISANQIITLSGDATGSGTTAITVTLANSGVTAGSYNYLTVNAKGLITGGSLATIGNIVTKTAAYTATTTDSVIAVDTTTASVTITLPASPLNGQIINIKKIDSSVNVVTISGNSKTIDGLATQPLSSQYDSLTVIYDGTQWWVL